MNQRDYIILLIIILMGIMMISWLGGFGEEYIHIYRIGWAIRLLGCFNM